MNDSSRWPGMVKMVLIGIKVIIVHAEVAFSCLNNLCNFSPAYKESMKIFLKLMLLMSGKISKRTEKEPLKLQISCRVLATVLQRYCLTVKLLFLRLSNH